MRRSGIDKACFIIIWMTVCCALYAKPLNIIIVTSDAGSEDGYKELLRDIYLDNAAVEIDADRYDESLSDSKKEQLSQADLIIISSDNDGSDYNGDAAFWSQVQVPILCHNTALARSNSHDNWDWFSSDRVTVPLTDIHIAEPNDPIFNGIDTTPGVVPIFETPENVELPDQPYAGNGTLLATDESGLPVLVRFDGNEPNYYDGSLYNPNGMPRVFFAVGPKPSDFFTHAAAPAKQLLRNAVTNLLPECWLIGDIDCDRDVDVADLAQLSSQWLKSTQPLTADIIPDNHVNIDDLILLAAFWLEGIDFTPPQPNPFDWTDAPAIQDGGTITMRAKDADDDLHGIQYAFQCLSHPALSSQWQYDRDYQPDNLPIGETLLFQAVARDTSSRFNETQGASPQFVRTDGLFYGSADASAAVALDDQRFIMADDENNVLRVYNRNLPASDPNQQTDVSAAITVDPAFPEADIEGATWFNNRVFWITSHGRNRDGQYRQSRYRFFATSVASDGSVTVDGVYENLIDDLIQYDRTWFALGIDLGLEDAIGTLGDHIDPATIPNLAPKVDGLNIEGLCTTADGTKMFIGFRNPRPHSGNENRALVIPLANPEAVILAGADPNLEAPILIDLDGLGIRSMEYSPNIGEYLIVAGSHQGGENEPVQYLYNYSIVNTDRDKLATFSDNMTPEAMFQFPGESEINLLSDDGTRIIQTPNGPEINKLLPRDQRTYRTRTIKP